MAQAQETGARPAEQRQTKQPEEQQPSSSRDAQREEAAASPQSSAQESSGGEERPSELPATGSAAPLMGLLGFVALGGALALRHLGKQEMQ
jgi:LPXTG-motif cell wall-anchored protein